MGVKITPSRRNSICKGPKEENNVEYLRNLKTVSVTGIGEEYSESEDKEPGRPR